MLKSRTAPLPTIAYTFVLLLATTRTLLAAPQGIDSTREEFQAKLGWRQGMVDVRDKMAALNLSPEFRFLDAEQSRRVIVKAWGNPPESADGVLGMIFPGNLGPLDPSCWAVVITYEEDGYVSDEGAEKIDYTRLLAEMKAQTVAANKQRQEAGYQPVELVGWAEAPRYDRESHKLYWAKELRFGDAPRNSLNYNIRVLGRSGVLVLNAVAEMEQLPEIQAGMTKILGMVEFREGHRYADYLPGKDKTASYGIAALVAGGVAVAAKAGLFKWLLAGLVAFKKVIILAFLALVGFLRRLFPSRAPEVRRIDPNSNVT